MNLYIADKIQLPGQSGTKTVKVEALQVWTKNIFLKVTIKQCGIKAGTQTNGIQWPESTPHLLTSDSQQRQ